MSSVLATYCARVTVTGGAIITCTSFLLYWSSAAIYHDIVHGVYRFVRVSHPSLYTLFRAMPHVRMCTLFPKLCRHNRHKPSQCVMMHIMYKMYIFYVHHIKSVMGWHFFMYTMYRPLVTDHACCSDQSGGIYNSKRLVAMDLWS